ncbi:TPA: hypothetical protein ACX6SI_003763 [Photobacterium damselae]
MYLLNRDFEENELIKQIGEQPRLFDFVDALYRGKEYKVSDLKNMDSENLSMSIYILTTVYPSESFFRAYNRHIEMKKIKEEQEEKEWFLRNQKQ